MKQVAPRKPLDERWRWLNIEVCPTVAVLTEAKVPDVGLPTGWTGSWKLGGIGPSRRWGTVIAAQGVELRDIALVAPDGDPVDSLWPGTVRVVEVVIEGIAWATVVGIYALTVGREGKRVGHGGFTSANIVRHLAPLLNARLSERLLVTGDFNLWPNGIKRRFKDWGLIDLSEHTAGLRPPLKDCCGCTNRSRCGHLWTHRNGNSPGAAHQQIDFIFVSQPLVTDLTDYGGGAETFPDVWQVSDHAPLFADFAWPPSDLPSNTESAVQQTPGHTPDTHVRTVIRRRRNAKAESTNG